MLHLRPFQATFTILVLSLLFVSAATVAHGSTSIGQEPASTPTPPSQSNIDLLLPNDIMQPVKQGAYGPLSVTAAGYKVVPILFVPNDLIPNEALLEFVNKQMQLIQRWYGEQLRDRTFDLEPARIVTGTHPLSYYYGQCYPPNTSCGWGYELWNNIFSDLSGLGYPWQSNRIHGVFFQHDGAGGPWLGGGNQFLVAIDPDNVIGDCLYSGCAVRVSEGGAAHELGHAFGLPHTLDDPEGSPGKSLMNYGFYAFPRATFVNTSINPERDVLYASPFMTVMLSLTDGGFEDCLTFWTVSSGSPSCTTASHRSGLSALQLSPSASQYQLSQDMSALAGQVYEVTGWVNVSSQTSSFSLQVQVLALSTTGEVLSTFIATDHTSATNDWARFGGSVTMPLGTTNARIQIVAQGLGAIVHIDDVQFRLAQQVPPAPLPMFYNDYDAVPTLQPTLRWAEVTFATSFRVQVASDKGFNSLIADATTQSPFYTLSSGLTYNTRYFWRVKAINGAGESDWSLIWSFIPRSEDDYHNDEFETGTLDSAWSWIREDASHWYFGGPSGRRGYGYLGITTQVGDLQSGNNAKNLLLRNSPSGDFEVSTKVDFWEPPDANYQQGGLLIYQNDQSYVKLTRIYSGTYGLELQAEASGAIVYQYFTPMWDSVPIKIARTGNSYSGYYSPDGIVWKRLGHPITVNLTNPKIGLAAYSVLDVKQITAYFDWFRVTPRCYEITTSVSPSSSGTVTKSPGDCNGDVGYSISSSVTISANPSLLYAFTAWSGDVTGTANPIDVTMNSDKTITANFAFVGTPVVPSITLQPTNQTVNAGQTATFSAAASGDPAPTVQWRVSTDGGATWANIPGVTSTTLSFTATSADNGKQYRAVFTNVAGTATTTAATLTVMAINVFPQNGILDNFNRANGALGSNWDGKTGIGAYKIVGNQVEVKNGGPLYWKPSSFGVNQEAFVKLTKVDRSASDQDLLLKVQGGASPRWTKGAIQVRYAAKARSGAGAVRVDTYRPSRGWLTYPQITVTFSDGDQLGGRALANGNVGVYKNGALVGTVTMNASDRTFFNSKGGAIGLLFYNGRAIFDNFGGGNVTPGVNFIANGGFEEGTYSQSGDPVGWTRDIWDWPNATLTWDNSHSYEGSKSAKITATVPNDARWIQTVSLQPNTNYRLSGQIKTEGVAHADGSVIAGANLGLYGTWEYTAGLFGTNDWTTVSMQFNSGDSTFVVIACRLGYWSGTATGTMWCDDIRLEPVQ